jgi:ElaB/YqjD/DUF883 family membrane-anchored ribosome-binding protein
MSDHHNNKSNTSAISDMVGMKSEDLEKLEKRLKEAKVKTSEFIRDYPLTSVAIGMGVGFLIGKLFSRK